MPQTLTVSPYILATQCRRPLIFQTMNSVRLNSLSLKYNWFTPSGCKDIEIRTFEFVANTQFLYNPFNEMDLCFPKSNGIVDRYSQFRDYISFILGIFQIDEIF